MPLDGSGNYYYPLGTPGVPNQTIESGKYNTFLDDLRDNDLNVARPVSRGGTGASTPEQARTNLGVMASAGGPMTGSIIVTGSITASTGPSAGTIYLGTDGTHYLHWDGTLYSLPNGPLFLWSLTSGGDITAGGVSNTGVIRFGHPTANYLYYDGTKFTLAGGPLFVSAFSTSTDSVFNAPIAVTRNNVGFPGEGLIQFGNVSGKWIHFYGNTYHFASDSNVSIGGSITSVNGIAATGTITAGGVTSTGNISSNGSIIADAGIDCNNLTTDSLTVGGNAVWHAGNFNPASYLPLSGGTVSGALSVTGDIRAGHGTASGKLVLGNTGQNLNFNVTNSDGWRLQGGAGGFHIDTNAVKPGGGTWDAPSDGRVKTLLGEYEHGLEQITRLKPQRFKYKDKSFDLVKDREFIGFVAQDVEPVMPEMVRKKTGVIDGKEVQDFRMTDTSALIFALVNACKELAARVEELESAG